MSATEGQEERKQRFAKIWWKSRSDAKKSQEYMAIHLGISKRTVQNWERGVSSPDLFQSAEWFSLLGQNPLHYYFEYLYPSLYESSSSLNKDEDVEQRLLCLVKQMTPVEQKQLLYMVAGDHGSSWYPLLQMIVAHCHTTMKSRVSAARVIAENYEMEVKSGDAIGLDNVLPDMETLNFAIAQGKLSAQDRKTGYTTQK